MKLLKIRNYIINLDDISFIKTSIGMGRIFMKNGEFIDIETREDQSKVIEALKLEIDLKLTR